MDPTFQRHIFIHNMNSIRIMIRKEIWQIIRGGKITNRVFRRNRDGSWKQIWGISGSFVRAGSTINGDRR